jgi:hypothetical protein
LRIFSGPSRPRPHHQMSRESGRGAIVEEPLSEESQNEVVTGRDEEFPLPVNVTDLSRTPVTRNNARHPCSKSPATGHCGTRNLSQFRERSGVKKARPCRGSEAWKALWGCNPAPPRRKKDSKQSLVIQSTHQVDGLGRMFSRAAFEFPGFSLRLSQPLRHLRGSFGLSFFQPGPQQTSRLLPNGIERLPRLAPESAR